MSGYSISNNKPAMNFDHYNFNSEKMYNPSPTPISTNSSINSNISPNISPNKEIELRLPVISIVSFSALIVVLAIICILFLVFVSWATPKTVTSVRSNIGVIMQQCPVDMCAVNVFNGDKRCPTQPGTSLLSNPEIEVCSSPFVCDNPTLPYALLSDGSTDVNGICETNTKCRCLSQSRCAENILSTFNTINGNNYLSLTGQRVQFIQKANQGATAGQALAFDDPSTTFCKVPLSWINRSSPGCSFTNNFNYSNLQECISNQNSYPCLQGVLAFYPDNPETFKASIENGRTGLLNYTPMACVRGYECIYSSDVLYYDSKLGTTQCTTPMI